MTIRSAISGAFLFLARLALACSYWFSAKKPRTLLESFQRATFEVSTYRGDPEYMTYRHEAEYMRREAERLSYKLACVRRRCE
ncbi:predicted protein [Ostreococcus lucimarinus CCE9901]|uniref:Uncharacterized protein n=1 Tax=Ostreococcus lucimarinus (strain CCE9901) TaxID=436017 RepID=A4SB21_OSTLU|nr:predicted protein [Ostreococcus lucimarinus CCE9901]ABP00857.1 predicted protein [Ostreococcus lucimarinus CCE9901]|eukprot:XP_001422540.1 predicted protein [Ostreococcus lucimarinus CCE9901]